MEASCRTGLELCLPHDMSQVLLFPRAATVIVTQSPQPRSISADALASLTRHLAPHLLEHSQPRTKLRQFRGSPLARRSLGEGGPPNGRRVYRAGPREITLHPKENGFLR